MSIPCPFASRSGLVSVVVPFFNRERHLHRAIESVLAQTYEGWELNLVDDGSTDASAEIALRYAARFPDRIRLFRQRNQGPGGARNRGIAEARGEFVAFLDSDDEWSPAFLARTVEAFARCSEVDWVYTNVQRKTEEDIMLVESVFDGENSGAFRSLATRRCHHLTLIVDPRFLGTAIGSSIKEGANSVVRRRVFERVSYPPHIRVGEDRVLNISAIAEGFRFGYIDEVLLTKYHHGDNVSMAEVHQVQKHLRSKGDLIGALKLVGRRVPLGPKERVVLRRTLGDLYYAYAVLLVESGAPRLRAAGFLAVSLALRPIGNPAWTAFRNRLRRIGGRAHRAAAGS